MKCRIEKKWGTEWKKSQEFSTLKEGREAFTTAILMAKFNGAKGVRLVDSKGTVREQELLDGSSLLGKYLRGGLK